MSDRGAVRRPDDGDLVAGLHLQGTIPHRVQPESALVEGSVDSITLGFGLEPFEVEEDVGILHIDKHSEDFHSGVLHGRQNTGFEPVDELVSPPGLDFVLSDLNKHQDSHLAILEVV
jgi:hypothetical protein